MQDAWNHFDEKGNAVMVDVGEKPLTAREAVAEGRILVSETVLRAVEQGAAAKGDVLGVARVAGIQAAKRTSELIPLCHPLPLSHIAVDFTPETDPCAVRCVCTVRLTGRTGAEMEALTGVSVALLTIYDMCKAMDKRMELTDVRLLRKQGGKSGVFTREE